MISCNSCGTPLRLMMVHFPGWMSSCGVVGFCEKMLSFLR